MNRTRLPEGAALVALTADGALLAARLKPALPAARIHGLGSRVAGADEIFSDTAEHLRFLFAAGRPIVGVCAAGILIRALAPLVANKRAEPLVIAVATDGGAVVPLLGGHRGANRLAKAIASALGGVAAITTAGDTALGFALDDPPAGWRVANVEAAKAMTAALLAGESVALAVESGDAAWLRESGIAFVETAPLRVLVTDRAVFGDASTLVLHPPVLAVGVGCERDADPEELARLVDGALATHGLSPLAVACVASIDLKADEPAVQSLARRLGVPARFYPAARLEDEKPRLRNPSAVVFRETGCHGVAEGAALAAAGKESVLVVSKVKSARATGAIARSPSDIDATAVGRGRGRLAIVGIGPGAAALRTPEASAALAESTDIVGYSLYVELLGSAATGKRIHERPLGAETERTQLALDLAAAGANVALISSGDAGIYGLASLAFELLDRENRPDWNRVAIAVLPGVSALQAAAAAAGAILGHDFAAISLSDLLTPWPDIERRLRAAAEGDFVVALYNPASVKRQRGIGVARDILLAHRAPDTPVVLARNLGRDGQRVDTITLAELGPDKVDMLTIVLIGSTQSRRLRRGREDWVYTPRGYERKST
ncbi:MAG: precorrin-3B C(17)-methyltransferase [Rhodospirillaceae bacterium]|nr:precorrin-3B C(17)-methyltransferase [Rhodospirillaceae bacterium]